MELICSAQPFILSDCVSILSRSRLLARQPEKPQTPAASLAASIGSHGAASPQAQSLLDAGALLDAVWADVLAAASDADEAALSRYFDAETEDSAPPALMLALLLEHGVRSLDSLPAERRPDLRYQLALTVLPGNDYESPEEASQCTEAALLEQLEACTAASPAARWTALWLFRHADEALAQTARLLEKPAAAYRAHLPALRPLFETALRLTREALGTKPKEALERLSNIRLDTERLPLCPQAFPWDGLSMWALLSYFDLTLHVGCCFWQLRALAEQETDAAEQILVKLKALDDRQRLKILSALREQPCRGKDLSELTGLSAATVSHHMSTLLNAGLVTLEKQGTQILYRPNASALSAFLHRLGKLLGCSSEA